MTAQSKPTPSVDELPTEVNFAGGTRGKFHQANAKLNLPVYLDSEVQAFLAALAAKKRHVDFAACERFAEKGHRTAGCDALKLGVSAGSVQTLGKTHAGRSPLDIYPKFSDIIMRQHKPRIDLYKRRPR